MIEKKKKKEAKDFPDKGFKSMRVTGIAGDRPSHHPLYVCNRIRVPIRSRIQVPLLVFNNFLNELELLFINFVVSKLENVCMDETHT